MGNWRVGRKVGRTIYDGDTLIGVMDTPELAARVVEAVNRRTASPVAPEGAAPTPPSEAVTPGQRPAPYHDTGTCDVCDGRRSGKPPFGDGTPSEPPRCDRCPHPPHVGACHGLIGHTAYQCVCIYDTVPSASATTEGPRGETPGRAEKPGGTR